MRGHRALAAARAQQDYQGAPMGVAPLHFCQRLSHGPTLPLGDDHVDDLAPAGDAIGKLLGGFIGSNLGVMPVA